MTTFSDDLAAAREGLARAINDRATRYYDGLADVRGLVRAAARLVNGETVHEAMGAPGDWGYESPIGKALDAFYRAGGV